MHSDYNHPLTPANAHNLHKISNTNVMLQELQYHMGLLQWKQRVILCCYFELFLHVKLH